MPILLPQRGRRLGILAVLLNPLQTLETLVLVQPEPALWAQLLAVLPVALWGPLSERLWVL